MALHCCILQSRRAPSGYIATMLAGSGLHRRWRRTRVARAGLARWWTGRWQTNHPIGANCDIAKRFVSILPPHAHRLESHPDKGRPVVRWLPMSPGVDHRQDRPLPPKSATRRRFEFGHLPMHVVQGLGSGGRCLGSRHQRSCQAFER